MFNLLLFYLKGLRDISRKKAPSAEIIEQHNRTNDNMCAQSHVQKSYSAIFHMVTDEHRAADSTAVHPDDVASEQLTSICQNSDTSHSTHENDDQEKN